MMRLAILSAPGCHVVTAKPWENGADPKGLPSLLADRIANGEAFAGERVVRLPRSWSRVYRIGYTSTVGAALAGRQEAMPVVLANLRRTREHRRRR
jgi:hypothetical protein